MYQSLAQDVADNIALSRRLCIEAAAVRTRYPAMLFALLDARCRNRALPETCGETRMRAGRLDHRSLT